MSAGPVRIETDRLELVAPLPVEAAAAVAAYQARNRAHFGPWDPARPPEFFEAAHWQEQLADDARAMADDRRVRFFARGRGEPLVIAHVHFADVVRGAFQSCHLGFGIDAAHAGRGLMREALEAAIGGPSASSACIGSRPTTAPRTYAARPSCAGSASCPSATRATTCASTARGATTC